MSQRGLLAIGIVFAWVIGIAAFTRRELTRSDAERLAESALRVAPGATYFAVLRDGKHVGYASTTVDTLPRLIQVVEYMAADVRAGDSLRRETIRTRVMLTRALVFKDFLVRRTTDSGPRISRGRIVNDSVLEFIVRTAVGARARTLDSVRQVVRTALTATPLLPIVTMLGGEPRVGRTADFSTLDPTSGAVTQAQVRLAAESVFVVSDSGAYAGTAAKWRSVHNDSVRAWRLDGLPKGGTLWVDALGRVVRHERPDGTTLQRTAHELAFENWRATSPLARTAPPPPSGPRP